MKNFVQSGDAIDINTPSGGLVAGAPFISNSMIGVAALTSLQDQPNVIYTEGVYEFPKVQAQAWALGVKIYWDAGAGKMTTTASGNTIFGIAAAVAANPTDYGRVKLGTPV